MDDRICILNPNPPKTQTMQTMAEATARPPSNFDGKGPAYPLSRFLPLGAMFLLGLVARSNAASVHDVMTQSSPVTEFTARHVDGPLTRHRVHHHGHGPTSGPDGAHLRTRHRVQRLVHHDDGREHSYIKPTLFLHFHKAGGTTTCSLYRAAGYRTGPESGNCFCPCGDERDLVQTVFDGHKMTGHRWVQVGGGFQESRGTVTAAVQARYRVFEHKMSTCEYDVCMLERGHFFPNPARYKTFRETFDGRISTVFRDPWSRFRSNYVREFYVVGLSLDAIFLDDHGIPRLNHIVEGQPRFTQRPDLKPYISVDADSGQVQRDRTLGALSRYTIDAFAADIPPKNSHLRGYDCVHYPNFYVRILNGVGGCADHAVTLGARHLETAKAVLETFDQIFVLEYLSNVQAGAMLDLEADPAIPARRKTFVEVFGPNTSTHSKSNNPFSHNANSWLKGQCRRALGNCSSEPPTAHFKPKFCAMNRWDNELYAWVLQRLKLAHPRGLAWSTWGGSV